MNRSNEEQRPVSQTLCGALQKEANCKCLVLSVLIYGCLAAVTWCRCANVTKIVINFSKYPLKSTRHVSPCDDGYIYIPVAFMGMLYLVYLVECYHSPIRIDLLHGESQDGVLSKLSQLRLAQPAIWWKAVSYHYVRRKRQITRYRNGDNYTTTQVYYERINSHAATSFYFYDYCGVKDISKELILDPKIPITKITPSKGFAFSNMRSATEFEEARSRFFAEQELRDDYMEMREGLDLGYSFNNSTTLVAVLGRPWFTNSYVYWCLSAVLLSWPLRIIIECNTQYANYQVTKLFGVNYDTPTNVTQIHASPSQLSAPGSYMLAPSYSEALLMDPAGPTGSRLGLAGSASNYPVEEMLVPSYSEALLYERAASRDGPATGPHPANLEVPHSAAPCNCPCHQTLPDSENQEIPLNKFNCTFRGHSSPDIRICSCTQDSQDNNRIIIREISAPNLKSSFSLANVNLQFLKDNGRSLENILESEENIPAVPEDCANKGAIPKRQLGGPCNSRSRMVDTVVSDLPSSKTYFSLKSILKQHQRRYTLVTTEELKNFMDIQNNKDNESFAGIFVQDNASKRHSWMSSIESKPDNPHRTLIFASPIHEVCRSSDPFADGNQEITAENLPVLTRLGQPLVFDENCKTALTNNSNIKINNFATNNSTNNTNKSIKNNNINSNDIGKCKIPRLKHHRTLSAEPDYLRFFTSSDHPNSSQTNNSEIITNHFMIKPGSLTRSFTERRPKPTVRDKFIRRSFTDERTDFGTSKRINLNMETSL